MLTKLVPRTKCVTDSVHDDTSAMCRESRVDPLVKFLEAHKTDNIFNDFDLCKELRIQKIDFE